MLRKSDYRGSIRTLTDAQLARLLTSANYRGLTGVAQAIRRERLRRDLDVVVPSRGTASVQPQPVDYTPPPRYDYDGYAGCRA